VNGSASDRFSYRESYEGSGSPPYERGLIRLKGLVCRAPGTVWSLSGSEMSQR
jgi:hypothetical protein